jgi:ABC-2 type transport system ATP-binding protein
MPLLEVQSISHAFGTRAVLRDVSFSLDAGVAALLGPNGAGKSTLFQILCTLLRPDSGKAQIAGHDVTREPAQVRRALGVVFQSPALDPVLTVRENLHCHGRVYGLDRRTITRKVDEAAGTLGVRDRLDDRVKILSGGLRRRVEIAKALISSPRVLLMDEPDAGLDLSTRLLLQQTLHDIARRDGVLVVLTTHIMDLAESADRVLMIASGEIVADDTPQALRQRLGRSVVEVRDGRPERIGDWASARGLAWKAHAGSVLIEAQDAALTLSQLAGELSPASLTLRQTTLADVFVTLTGEGLDRSEPLRGG